MTTDTEIANLALSHLGVRAMASLEENTATSRQVRTVYAMQRDSVLRAHGWNFASRTEILAPVSGESLLSWTYIYGYPANALRILKILNESSVEGRPEKFKEIYLGSTNAKGLAAMISPAYAEYTARIEDPSLFDALFVDAFAYLLAAVLAQPLTGKLELGQAMAGEYRAQLGEARRLNKTEGTDRALRRSPTLDAR